MAGGALRAAGLIAVIVITTWLTVPWGPFGRPANLFLANQEVPPITEASPQESGFQQPLTAKEAREQLYYIMELLFARADIRNVEKAIEGLRELAALLPERYRTDHWEGHPPSNRIIGGGQDLSPKTQHLAERALDEKASLNGEGDEYQEIVREVRRVMQEHFDSLDNGDLGISEQNEFVEEGLAKETAASEIQESTLRGDTENGGSVSADENEVEGQQEERGEGSSLGRLKGTAFAEPESGPEKEVWESQGRQEENEEEEQEQDGASKEGEKKQDMLVQDTGFASQGNTLPPVPEPRAPPSVASKETQSGHNTPAQQAPGKGSDKQEALSAENVGGDAQDLNQVLERMGRYKTSVGTVFGSNSEVSPPSTPANGLADSTDSTASGLSHTNPPGVGAANPPGLEGATSPALPNDLVKALFDSTHKSEANEEWEETREAVAADAVFLLGVLTSTGVAHKYIPLDRLKALEQYGGAAEAGAMQAQLALAHWYHQGFFVNASCPSALWYLRSVADTLMASSQEAGDMVLPRAPVRLRERERDAAAAVHDLLDLDAPDQVAWDEDLALRGVAEAQRHVGYRRLLGRGVDQDVHEARRYFEAAAGAGDPYAAFNLGYMYMRGIAHPTNYTAARELFEYAAEDDLPAAYNGLGVLYYSGWGVPQNYTKAREYFEMGAEFQDPDSLYNLGSLYMGGFGVWEDMKTAYAYIQNASHAGHWKAPYTLGIMHADGTGVEQNCSQAVQFLNLFVSERGQWPDELEQAFLAYSDGDEWSALVRYLILAEQGSQVACVNAAFILRKSKAYNNTDRFDLALDLLERTRDSEANLRSGALIDIGDLHYYGRVKTGEDLEAKPRSTKSPLAFYEEAAKSHDPEALYSMAWIYEHGELGEDRDHNRALELLDEAIEHAFLEELLPLFVAHAYFHLHDFYMRGSGFVSNIEQEFVRFGEGVVDQGDTILLLVLSTILFWAVARLRRRLNQEVNPPQTIAVGGEGRGAETVEVLQPRQAITIGAANAGGVTSPAGQSQTDSREGELGTDSNAHGAPGRAGDLRHRAVAGRS